MYDDWSFISCGHTGCDEEKGVAWGFDDEFQAAVITDEGWAVLDLRKGDFRCPRHKAPLSDVTGTGL